MTEELERSDVPTAVVDCNVFLRAAVLSPSSVRVMEAIDEGRCRLIASAATFLEVQEVLYRPQVRAKLPRLTDARAEYVLSLMAEKAIPYRQIPLVFTYERDPKDEKYINLAIAAQPNYLLTFDKDLLALAHDEELRRHCPNTKIISPADVNFEEAA